MTTVSNLLSRAADSDRRRDTARPAGSARFDWVMVALSAWLLGGLFLDGWAHTHGQTDESFFTPWHAVLYSGHLAVTVYLSANAIRNQLRGYSLRQALPAGYGLSLAGALLFAIGGVSDLIWHELFGVEADVEALYSPTHLTLAIAAVLMIGGPLRAAWQNSTANARGLREQLPMLLSATFVLSVLTFFTQIAHPLANLWGVHGGQGLSPAYAEWEQELGVVSILLDAGLLVGATLLLMQRWTLPPGALTLIFTLNAVAMGFLYDVGFYPLAQVAARAAAGAIADALYRQLRPSIQRIGALRAFSFAVPAVAFGLYFVASHAAAGIGWTIHLWTGSIVLAGIVGLLLSYVAVPLPIPAAD